MERQLPFSGGTQILLAIEGPLPNVIKGPIVDRLQDIIYLLSYAEYVTKNRVIQVT